MGRGLEREAEWWAVRGTISHLDMPLGGRVDSSSASIFFLPFPPKHGMEKEAALLPLLTYSVPSTKPKTHGDLEHLLWFKLWFRHQSLLCGTESK